MYECEIYKVMFSQVSVILFKGLVRTFVQGGQGGQGLGSDSLWSRRSGAPWSGVGGQMDMDRVRLSKVRGRGRSGDPW